MKRRFGISRELLRESDDALRSILGLLDDVVPATADGVASSLDIHLALGALEELYADERGERPVQIRGLRAAVETATRLGPNEVRGA